MPSQIKVDEIKNVAGQYKIKTNVFEGQTTAGSITVQGEGTNTTNLQQGLAKTWFQFNGTGTPANRGSFNVTSLTDNGTGNYTQVFTNNMIDQNYATSGIAGGKSGNWSDSLDHMYVDNPCLTTSVQLASSYNTNLADTERSAGQISGDLA